MSATIDENGALADMLQDQVKELLHKTGDAILNIRRLSLTEVNTLERFSGGTVYFEALPQLDKLAAEAFLLLDRDKIRINELFVSEYLESLSLSTILRLSRFVIGGMIIDDIPIDATEVSLFREFKGKQFLTRIKPGEINTAKAIAQVEAELIAVNSTSFSDELLDALSKTKAEVLQLFANEPISPEAIDCLAGYNGTLIVSVPNEEAVRAYKSLTGGLEVVDKDISMSVADELSLKDSGSIYLSGIDGITPAIQRLLDTALVTINLPGHLC